MQVQTLQSISECLGVSYRVAWSRCKDSPYMRGTQHQIALVDILPVVRQKEIDNGAVERLFATAKPHPYIHVPATCAPSIRKLEASLTPIQADRLLECRLAFCAALAAHTKTSDSFTFYERARMALAFESGVLRYAILGDSSQLSRWNEFAALWSIICSSPENLCNPELKESVNDYV